MRYLVYRGHRVYSIDREGPFLRVKRIRPLRINKNRNCILSNQWLEGHLPRSKTLRPKDANHRWGIAALRYPSSEPRVDRPPPHEQDHSPPSRWRVRHKLLFHAPGTRTQLRVGAARVTEELSHGAALSALATSKVWDTTVSSAEHFGQNLSQSGCCVYPLTELRMEKYRGHRKTHEKRKI